MISVREDTNLNLGYDGVFRFRVSKTFFLQQCRIATDQLGIGRFFFYWVGNFVVNDVSPLGKSVIGWLKLEPRYKYLIVKLRARIIMNEFEMCDHLRLEYHMGRIFCEGLM